MPRQDKKELVREFIGQQVARAIDHMIADKMVYATGADEAMALSRFKKDIAARCGWQITEPYRFLELCDIMEWKWTRERR